MKVKMYGQNHMYKLPNNPLDLRYQRKQRQRQRESTTRKPVAAQIAKEKETEKHGSI